MATCKNCGSNVNDDIKYCPNCGTEVAAQAQTQEQPQAQAQPQQSNTTDFTTKVAQLNDTADTTAEFDANDISQNKIMAVLSYIGILFLIPMFAAKESKFAHYHANQGLVLFVFNVAYSIAASIVGSVFSAISYRLMFVSTILNLGSIVFLVLAIIGIINACNGKAKELPVIGKFKFLK